jgi:hypothetical protein
MMEKQQDKSDIINAPGLLIPCPASLRLLHELIASLLNIIPQIPFRNNLCDLLIIEILPNPIGRDYQKLIILANTVFRDLYATLFKKKKSLPGSQLTPKVVATKSPTALVIANPGIFSPLSQTLKGPTPSPCELI